MLQFLKYLPPKNKYLWCYCIHIAIVPLVGFAFVFNQCFLGDAGATLRRRVYCGPQSCRDCFSFFSLSSVRVLMRLRWNTQGGAALLPGSPTVWASPSLHSQQGNLLLTSQKNMSQTTSIFLLTFISTFSACFSLKYRFLLDYSYNPCTSSLDSIFLSYPLKEIYSIHYYLLLSNSVSILIFLSM